MRRDVINTQLKGMKRKEEFVALRSTLRNFNIIHIFMFNEKKSFFL